MHLVLSLTKVPVVSLCTKGPPWVAPRKPPFGGLVLGGVITWRPCHVVAVASRPHFVLPGRVVPDFGPFGCTSGIRRIWLEIVEVSLKCVTCLEPTGVACGYGGLGRPGSGRRASHTIPICDYPLPYAIRIPAAPPRAPQPVPPGDAYSQNFFSQIYYK